MPLDHLGLRLPARIEAVQCVEHQIGKITRSPVEGHDRVRSAVGATTKVLAAAAPPMRGAASPATAPTRAFSRSRLCIGVSSLSDLLGGNVAYQPAAFRPQNGYRATVFLRALGAALGNCCLIGFLPVREDGLTCLEFRRRFGITIKVRRRIPLS
jgi:hypothetical protein